MFARLTNSYCLVALQGSENFYSAFETELANQIPVSGRGKEFVTNSQLLGIAAHSGPPFQGLYKGALKALIKHKGALV